MVGLPLSAVDYDNVASDSTHFGAFDRNIFTESHARYGGHGVLIYWHVERKKHGHLLPRRGAAAGGPPWPGRGSRPGSRGRRTRGNGALSLIIRPPSCRNSTCDTT